MITIGKYYQCFSFKAKISTVSFKHLILSLEKYLIVVRTMELKKLTKQTIATTSVSITIFSILYNQTKYSSKLDDKIDLISAVIHKH